MGEAREQITLVNGADLIRAGDGLIAEQEIRQMTVEAIVDTGAWLVVMGEETRRSLGLSVIKESVATLAGGMRQACKITEPVGIRWKDRDTECRAMVLPNMHDILLGCLPLEGMDLMVDPVNQRLVGAHGDEQAYLVR